MNNKTWDFVTERDRKKRVLEDTRKLDLVPVLKTFDAHSKQHEALQEAASLLAHAVNEWYQKMLDQVADEGQIPTEHLDALESDFQFHVQKVAQSLVQDAVSKLPRKLRRTPWNLRPENLTNLNIFRYLFVI